MSENRLFDGDRPTQTHRRKADTRAPEPLARWHTQQSVPFVSSRKYKLGGDSRLCQQTVRLTPTATSAALNKKTCRRRASETSATSSIEVAAAHAAEAVHLRHQHLLLHQHLLMVHLLLVVAHPLAITTAHPLAVPAAVPLTIAVAC